MRPAEGEYGDEETYDGFSQRHGAEGPSVALPSDGASEGAEEWLPTISKVQESWSEEEDDRNGGVEALAEPEEEQPLLDELWPEETPSAREPEVASLPEELWLEGLEPAVEEELPDSLELFERLQQEAASTGEELEPAVEDELPDPLELFERLQREAAPSEELDAETDEGLPDSLELFESLRREQTVARFENVSRAAHSPSASTMGEAIGERESVEGYRGPIEESPEWDEFDEELPDPQALFQKLQGMSLDQLDPPETAEPISEREGFPAPLALYEPDERGEVGEALEPSPGFVDEGSSPASGGLSQGPPALPDPKALYEQLEAEEEEPAAVGFFGRIRQALFRDRGESKAAPSSPPALPDPAELYRQLEQEDEQEDELEQPEPSGPFAAPRIAAGGWAPVLSELPVEPDEDLRKPADELPSPEELFRAIEEEYAQESGLPELPDLEAFKAELEAEERARLDPDLLEELSGPERFVETVSDFDFEAGSLFGGSIPEETALPAPGSPRPASTEEPPASKSVLRELADSEKSHSGAPGALSPARMEGPGDGPVLGAPVRTDQRGSSGTVKVDFTAEDDDYERPSTLLGQKGPSFLSRTYQPTFTEKRSRGGRPGTRAIIAEQPGRTAVQMASSTGLRQRFFRRKRAFDRQSLSIFTRQLGAMLNAGIPLHLALAFCAESDPDLAPILSTLVEKVETGYSLSGALGEYPDSFDPVYIGLVQTGELSGRLNEMLSRLADVLERELELKKRMMSVVTYPAMLMVVSLLGTLGFLFFVLPQITPLFLDLEVELPLPTRILLTTKELLLPGLAGLVVSTLLYWATRKRIAAFVSSKPLLKRRLSGLPFRVPILGRVYEKVITARVLYALSTMLDVGVTMNQALARSETAAGNAHIAHRLKGAREDLAEGVPVSECFRNHRVFSETALHLISAGEEAARLSEMFSYVAEHFDEEVGYALDSAASMLEPAIMVIMGAVVGFIVVAAALPTIHLLQNFS